MPVDLDARVLANRRLSPDYNVLALEAPAIAKATAPGQFVMVKPGHDVNPLLRRPFSVFEILRDEHGGPIGISILSKRIGATTRLLYDAEPGARVQCLGPLGRPFSLPAEGVEALMIAGGYGIAPFLMLSAELRRRGGAGRVFYGGRTARDLQVRAPFAGLDVSVISATEDGTLGHRGRVTEPLEAYLDGAHTPSALYACGPDPMLHAVARIAEHRGLPCQVSLDPWMGCGVGTCLGCVVWTQREDEARAKYRCACTEGPVFDASVVVWPAEGASWAHRRAKVAV